MVHASRTDFPIHLGVWGAAQRVDVPTRDGFGRGLIEAGEEDDRVVVLCADLAESTRTAWFRERFPDRFVEVGVAEQNLAALASGMAAAGLRPVIASYAAFSPGRNWEQIRTTIALNDQPVVIAGMHAGVSVGPDGATHQALEDIATMRVIPRMVVIAPADSEEARKATYAALQEERPIYLRFARAATPLVTLPSSPFRIGEGYRVWESAAQADVVIASTGPLLAQALWAARSLANEGVAVRVLHLPTIKPLPCTFVLDETAGARGVVSVEEHQSMGGFGSALAELFAQHRPTLMRFIAVNDQFGQSGSPSVLLEHYGLTADAITQACHSLLAS